MFGLLYVRIYIVKGTKTRELNKVVPPVGAKIRFDFWLDFFNQKNYFLGVRVSGVCVTRSKIHIKSLK